jgi:hypothetical protein
VAVFGPPAMSMNGLGLNGLFEMWGSCIHHDYSKTARPFRARVTR